MVVVQLVFTAPSLIASYALLRRKDWARTASIVAAVLAAMSAPVGTAACVYSLWFFLGENWKEVYPDPAWRKTEPRQIAYEPNSRWTGQKRNEKGEVTYHHVEPPDWR